MNLLSSAESTVSKSLKVFSNNYVSTIILVIAPPWTTACAAAPVPDLAPLQHRGAAATRHAAKDPAQHRRPRPRARSRPRPLGDRQALP